MKYFHIVPNSDKKPFFIISIVGICRILDLNKQVSSYDFDFYPEEQKFKSFIKFKSGMMYTEEKTVDEMKTLMLATMKEGDLFNEFFELVGANRILKLLFNRVDVLQWFRDDVNALYKKENGTV